MEELNEMADEEKKAEDEAVEGEAAEAQAPKKKSPIIIIAALVLVGLILAGGISYFVTTKLMANSMQESDVPKNHDPGVFIKLGDAKEGIIVNVGGVKGGHYLKAGIVIEMNPGKSANINKEGHLNQVAETKLLDTSLQILRSEPLENFDATKQDALKNKLKNEINRVLGEGSVYNVYITSFVLQ